MNSIDVSELPDEMMKLVENKFRELDELNQAVKQRDALREDLMRTLDVIGIKLGQRLESQQLGLYAMLMESEYHKIDREALISLGVSEAIIDRATVTTKKRPHVRFGQAFRPRHRIKN
jgi:hypothetical protein